MSGHALSLCWGPEAQAQRRGPALAEPVPNSTACNLRKQRLAEPGGFHPTEGGAGEAPGSAPSAVPSFSVSGAPARGRATAQGSSQAVWVKARLGKEVKSVRAAGP